MTKPRAQSLTPDDCRMVLLEITERLKGLGYMPTPAFPQLAGAMLLTHAMTLVDRCMGKSEQMAEIADMLRGIVGGVIQQIYEYRNNEFP